MAETSAGQRLPAGKREFLRRMRTEIAERDYRRIRIEPVGVTVGAVVHGVDLGGDVDDAVFGEIEQAFLDYKVLFFHDQSLTAERQQAFARRFGELEQHPFLPSAGEHDRVVRFEKNEAEVGVENIWHADVTWRERPALGALLRAEVVPEIGGDTLFADMVAAHEGLPESLKTKLAPLRAVHDFANSFGLILNAEQLAAYRERFPPVEHPVVATHPATGKRVLFVNAIFTSHIVGMDREESDALLEVLFQQAMVPEYQCRFRWRARSVAMWDNRSVQHYAPNDYWPERRVMERVAIVGHRPT